MSVTRILGQNLEFEFRGQSKIKYTIKPQYMKKHKKLMAGLVRVSHAGVPQHIVQRENNRQLCSGGEGATTNDMS